MILSYLRICDVKVIIRNIAVNGGSYIVGNVQLIGLSVDTDYIPTMIRYFPLVPFGFPDQINAFYINGIEENLCSLCYSFTLSFLVSKSPATSVPRRGQLWKMQASTSS